MNAKQRAAIARRLAYALESAGERAKSGIDTLVSVAYHHLMSYADRIDPYQVVYSEIGDRFVAQIKGFDTDLSQYPLFPKWPGYPGIDRTTHEQ